jgi:hypothetical protein
MNDQQILKRKIQLKRQARDLIRDEIFELQSEYALVVLKNHYEKQIEDSYHPELSRKIDCINFLIEN